MSHITVHDGPAYRFLGIENVTIILSVVVLVLTYIDALGSNSHHASFALQCCSRDFWLSPPGFALVLVLSSLLLRLHRTPLYFAVMIFSFFILAFLSYVTFQKWSDYSTVNKAYAFQQALLPLYRPLSILLSVLILGITTRKAIDLVQSRHLR